MSQIIQCCMLLKCANIFFGTFSIDGYLILRFPTIMLLLNKNFKLVAGFISESYWLLVFRFSVFSFMTTGKQCQQMAHRVKQIIFRLLPGILNAVCQIDYSPSIVFPLSSCVLFTSIDLYVYFKQDTCYYPICIKVVLQAMLYSLQHQKFIEVLNQRLLDFLQNLKTISPSFKRLLQC